MSRRDKRDKGQLEALQAALAAEHAAVYGYGVVGGRLRESQGKETREAREAYDAHRARRDALTRAIRDLGGRPVAAAAAYALPFPVPDSAAAVRFAAELEERVAGVYSDLVRASTGERRREAAGALREAAVRAVRWRGEGVAFPGLAERAGTGAKSTADATDTAHTTDTADTADTADKADTTDTTDTGGTATPTA